MSEAAKAFRVYVGLAVVVVMAGLWLLFMPSDRIWYFGAHNESVFGIEGWSIYWGDSSSYHGETILGRLPVVFAFLVWIAVPVWVVDRQMVKSINRRQAKLARER